MAKRLAAFVGLISAAVAATAQQQTVDTAIQQGLGPFLLFCVGGALLALLTPCVFPMVPITVSVFAKRTEGSALKPALVYCTGIVSTFVILGIGTALIFGATGILKFATNGWVNLGLGLLFVALALNLFGVYEIRLPSGLARSAGQQAGRKGNAGLFFMGMTFALTSYTCTAPVVGGLLVAATGGSLFYPLVGMTTFGVVFAAPFFLLAMFPSAMSKMPRSGDWLSVVKPALGFVELAAAVKFFSNADLAFELGVITRPVFLAAWAVLFVCMAGYLLGIPKAIQTAGLGRRITGIATLCLAAVLALGAFRYPIGKGLESFPPPDPYPTKTSARSTEPSSSGARTIGLPKKGAITAKDFDEAVELAKQSGRTIFVDFTGVTCVNCRLMEKNIFPKPEVVAEFDKMVTVQLYTDRENPQDEANKKLQGKLANNIALPTYVLVKPDGTVIDKYEGLAPSAEEFAMFLKKGTS